MPTPASPINLSGDVQQLQRWAKEIEVTLKEISNSVNRLTNMLQQVITLNHLKSKP